MSHHKNVFIGVGGQGGASLAAIKRAMLYRSEEMAALYANPYAPAMVCRFLYIDSNADELQAACKTRAEGWNYENGRNGLWYAGREDLRLDVAETCFLDALQVTSTIAMQRPNIAPWLGDGTVFDGDEVVQGRGETLAGAAQRRRYGRVLFASCAHEVSEKLSAIIAELDAIPGPDPAPNREGITFHVFATVGGGTGSGSLIDLCTLLRTLHANRVEFEKRRANPSIYLYLYVGGTAPQVAQNAAGCFYGNEYATLRDLNGLVSGRYSPFMAAVLPVNQQDHHFRDASCVKCMFLNSEEATRSLSLAEQIENMAHTCLDSIALVLSGNKNGQVLHSITAQDVKGNFPGERKARVEGFLKNEAVPAGGGAGQPERSYYFQSAKVVRMRHPSQEIQEWFKCTYACQVCERWLNGPTTGRTRRNVLYVRENCKLFPIVVPGGSDYAKRLAKYRDDKLAPYTLENAKAESKKVNYDVEVLANINEEVRKTLLEIIAHVEEVRQAKALGRRDPYVHDAKEAALLMKGILIEVIENMRRWTNVGDSEPWGIYQIRCFLESLRIHLDTESGKLDEFDDSLGNMPLRCKEWEKLGPGAVLIARAEGVYVTHCQEAYAVLKRALVWHDLQLLRILVMSELRTHVTTCIDNIACFEAELQKYLDDEKDDGAKVSERLANANPEVFVYLYDRERTKEHVLHIQMLSDAEYRSDMAEIENRYFGAISGGVVPFNGARLRAIMNDLNAKTAGFFWGRSRSKHDRIAILYGSVLFASVYEAADPDDDVSNCEKVSRQAGLPIILKEGYFSPIPGGRGADVPPRGPAPYKAVAIGMAPLPGNIDGAKAERLRKRLERLKSLLTARFSTKVTLNAITGDDVYDHNDPLEIRVFYTAYWTPARMMSVVDALQSKYEKICARTLTGAIDTSTLYFNNIDDGCLSVGNTERPPLVQEDLLEVVQQRHDEFMQNLAGV